MRRTALLAAVLLLAGLTDTPPATAAPAAAPACGSQSSHVSGLVRQAHPVVLAHGWTGAVMSDTRTKLEAAMGDGWQFLLFDYHDASAEWAASPRIAGCFATYLKAVSDSHLKAGGDGLVYVVAHSMGGLALRFAVDPRYGKVPSLGSRIGGLVTLATPHRGSPWGESGIYTQLVNLKNTAFLDAVPPGQDASRCLALHQRGTGLPEGCGAPPYLPVGVRVDQVAGVATVKRSFFGVHAYDIALGGDSIVGQDSAHGYLGSAVGGTTGASTRSTQVPCSLEWDALGAVLTGGVIGTLARLKLDGEAMDALQAGRTSPALIELLAAANTLMPCSHIGITTSDAAITQTAAALRADVRAKDARALPALPPTAVNVAALDAFLHSRIAGDFPRLEANSVEDEGCTVVSVAGADLPAGDLDVYIGVPGGDCGGDAAGTFYKVRDGVLSAKGDVCGDCDEDFFPREDFDALVAPYGQRDWSDFDVRRAAQGQGFVLEAARDPLLLYPGGLGTSVAGQSRARVLSTLRSEDFVLFSDGQEDNPERCRTVVVGAPGRQVVSLTFDVSTDTLLWAGVDQVAGSDEAPMRSDRGLAVGDPESRVRQLYPEASTRPSADSGKDYVVTGRSPGDLVIGIDDAGNVAQIRGGASEPLAAEEPCG